MRRGKNEEKSAFHHHWCEIEVGQGDVPRGKTREARCVDSAAGVSLQGFRIEQCSNQQLQHLGNICFVAWKLHTFIALFFSFKSYFLPSVK